MLCVRAGEQVRLFRAGIQYPVRREGYRQLQFYHGRRIGNGCLHCLGLLDQNDVRRYLSSEAEQAAEAAIYGVPREALGEAGPSVSPVNGIVASLGATEFMVAVTGMAEPRRLVNYTGHLLRLTKARAPGSDCPYCKGIRGEGAAADVERYLKMPHLQRGGAQ